MENEEKHKDIDALLNRIFSKSSHYALNELFEQRLAYLNITKHQALKILNIDHKTLDSILAGDSKKIDFVTILKLSDFLETSYDEIISKYFQQVNSTHHETIGLARKRSFIVNNFNLPGLKKM